MNEELRDRVHKGMAFLDEKIPDWLDKVGDLDTLDMSSCEDCIACRVTKIQDYSAALKKLRLFWDKEYGFNAAASNTLTNIWREEIRLRRDEGGEYPWVWKGYPARIVEENIRGVIGDKVLILYLASDVEIPVIAHRDKLHRNHGIKLKIGTKFNYDGFPRMVVAIPGMKALLIQPDTGGYIDEASTATFKDAVFDTFTPEDFGLDPEKVEIKND